MVKRDPNVLTYRDARILASQLSGDTLNETAAKVGVSRDTIKRTKRKPVYRDVLIAAIEKQGYQIEELAGDLVKMTKANKEINIDGEPYETSDNITRFNAVKKLCDIFGVDAPKEINLNAESAAIPDEELLQELLGAEAQLNEVQTRAK